jgi:hypothetical protein
MMTFGPDLSVCGAEKKAGVHRVLDVGTGTGIWYRHCCSDISFYKSKKN